MILYFANRQMEILGKAATNLKRGFVITEDLKTEDVESGVAVLDCKIGYIPSNRKRLENMTKAGNYILRQNEGSTEFYTIIDREIDTKHQTVYVYAEDAGLDLINEIAEAYTATEAHPAEWYINKWIIDSGFEIGINEIPASSQRKLAWEGEATVTERLASIATQFGGYEISFSFAIKGMEISNKYVNIYAERGKNTDEQLRLNRDIDRIIMKESVANLATALRCTGGMLDDGETHIDLKGYSYDDGDCYVAADGILRSRNAVAKWSRYVWNKEPNKLENYAGHIIRSYSYDTLNQATLCAHAVTELKKICDTEVNYEIDIKKLPENIKIGDRVNIVDAAGELYLSSRILKLETSVTENTQTATIGEHLIKEGGISSKVEELAAQFVEATKSAAKALATSNEAKTAANDAKTQADNALAESENAKSKADEATIAASNATQSAAAAQAAASNAQAAVDNVEKSVEAFENAIENAQTAAGNAQKAAETADTKADEAAQAAANAMAEAANAQAAVVIAQGKAESAVAKAETAQSTAETAKTEANTAKTTADAAKLDAEKANEDIEKLGQNLDTLSHTMEADYARKTDLTEAEAHLQTQITQNAAEIASNASKIVIVDETANNAAEQAEAAQKTAEAAQAQADAATEDAVAAQKAADDAAEAAQAAQNEANAANTAAATAQSVADKAKNDLTAAQAELNKVKADVTSTQEDIAAAEQAVANAQTKADAAQADAATAAQKAAQAQNVADTASQNASNAQSVATQAAKTAADAQAKAEAAQGDATEAINTANTAKNTAAAAQEVANTAKTNAANAQAKANEAASEAAAAQSAADAADAKAQTAANDLATAKANLASVTSRVDATEEEIAAAEAAVAKAQSAADAAKADAATAQSTANTAKNNAATAQTAANAAKTAADAAQKAADDAQAAADAAQKAVDNLAVRVTTTETKITQNSEQIALRATKTEVANTLGGYYTKTQTDAAITTKANEITSSVSNTYATKKALQDNVDNLAMGARNLLLNSNFAKLTTGNGSSLHEGIYASGWIGYNGGISNPTTSYHAHIDTTTFGINVLEFNESNGLRNWKGVNPDLTGRMTQYGEYILSFDAYATLSGGKIYGGFYYHKIGSTSRSFHSGQYSITDLPVGKWGRVSVKVPLNDDVDFDKAISCYIYGYGFSSNAIVYIKNVMLSEGNIASDWTPAPEDMATSEEVTSLATRVTQTESSITSQASSISSLGTRMSTVEQTASGLTVSLQTTNSNVTTAQNTADAAKKIADAGAKKINTHMRSFTKANWQNYGAEGHEENWSTGSNYDNSHIKVGDVAYIVGKVSDAGGSNDVYATIYGTVTAVATTRVTMTSLYYIMGGEGGAYALANSANTAATAAAKTATNFLSYDSTNGLLIGNKSSGSWAGSRAQILPSAFNILDSSGAILASYGTNTIELGKNSETAVVKLCGSSGEIWYDTPDLFNNKHLCIKAINVGLFGMGSAKVFAYSGSYDWSYVQANPNDLTIKVNYSVAQSDGTAVYSGSEIDMNQTEIYALADDINLVSRYNTVLDSVAGGVTIKPYLIVEGETYANGILYIKGATQATGKIYANGGLRLKNGGQITGLTSGGTEITMLQMNANNYTMLGYGGYSNKIGATYLDGNTIYMRSNGDIDMTCTTTKVRGALTVSGNFTAANGTATLGAIELHRSTPYIDFHFGKSTADYTSRIAEYASGTLTFECTAGVIMQVTGDSVGLYKSSSSTYSGHFRPNTDGKCTLGIAANRWYAVYASNASIQTSDRREKENIKPFGVPEMMVVDGDTKLVDLHSELFDRLQPVQYNMINGSGKVCYGLIAQDVVEAMHEVGIGEDDLDLVHHDFWTDEKSGDTKESYGLAYTNLIAMLIHEVQKLKCEVQQLKNVA